MVAFARESSSGAKGRGYGNLHGGDLREWIRFHAGTGLKDGSELKLTKFIFIQLFKVN